MNISCEIIRDLLPLYVDEVCSDDSRNLVENHLQGCEGCKTELNYMKGDLPQQKEIAEETKTVKAMQNAWKKSKKITIEKIVILGIMLFVLCVILFYPDMPMPVFEKDLEVRNVCQLEDGTVYFEWEMTNGTLAAGRHRTYREKDGACYFVPLRAVVEAHMRYWITRDPSIMERQPYDYEYIHPYGKWADRNQTVFEDMTAIYVGWGKDAILVWEPGMELPVASEEIEAEYARMLSYSDYMVPSTQ